MDLRVQTVETTQRLRVERVVNRYGSNDTAEFYHVREDGRWLAARAWVQKRGEERYEPLVEARGGGLRPSEAGAVQVALRMAIDWVAGEMRRSSNILEE